MCLYKGQNAHKIAKKDIVCYKNDLAPYGALRVISKRNIRVL